MTGPGANPTASPSKVAASAKAALQPERSGGVDTRVQASRVQSSLRTRGISSPREGRVTGGVGPWLLACLLAVGSAGAQTAPTPAPSPAKETPVVLGRVDVAARTDDPGIDPTGMGSYEQQLRDPVFSNALIDDESLEEDAAALELRTELRSVATPSAVDLATGDSRVGLRGFPTPLLSNGFVRLGGVDLLNVGRTLVIQGALVPVLGRAAPGGIQDYWTARPRTTPGRSFSFTAGTLRRQAASLELNAPTIAKRAWHRVAAGWTRRTGPEAFAASETRSLDAALTWRHGPAASTQFAVDYYQLRATAAPAIPEYRVAAGQRIRGPYLPLAGFNALGPEAGVRRRSAMASVMHDAQVHPRIALRAGLEAWWRRIEQDRFTTGLLNLSLGRFEGIREPLHSEQPQGALIALAEATARFAVGRTEHKLMASLSHTRADLEREERALTTALRNALPASIRNFDPAQPDYRRPAFNRADYGRIITDRGERAAFTALELSDRLSANRGRTVVTGGARADLVSLAVEDRRPGLAPALARVNDETGEVTWHTGINHQAIPGRLLLFATSSTAFNPSTRVDGRTGQIQGNETTRGHEAGTKARLAGGRLDVTASAFSWTNSDISRRNPLYGDPVLDALHTQPQLVAAGEERFAGGKLEARWRLLPTLQLAFAGSHVRGVTTASPDLPEEVGRRLTRFPPYNASASASYSFGKGRWSGLSLSGSWIYISDFTAYYADRLRENLEYPGYGLVHLGVSYSRRAGTRTHGTSLSVRNALDRDLLRSHHRLGQDRELALTYRLSL